MSADYSSSNPFRRKDIPATSIDTTTSNHIAYQEADPAQGSEPLELDDVPKKVTKKVRVQSPPSSPSIPDSASTIGEEAYTIRSKPPTTLTQEGDPFESKEMDEDEDELGTTQSTAPANPFSKTLETMEQSAPAGAGISSTSGAGSGKAVMDVDAFKRLLMTGDSGLGSSTPPAQPPHTTHASGDGGSSTDASSVSRQSLFDAMQETHGESPRTSHEMSEQEYESRGGGADSIASTAGRKKPPPPTSRHGKVIKVELRDDPSTVTVHSPTTPPSNQSQEFFSTSPRSLTDLNKPLPPAPARASHDSERESIFDKEAAGKTPELPSRTSSLLKKAPPVPLTRRYSQRISDVKVIRSEPGRLTPNAEEEMYDSSTDTSNRPRSNSARAPPPPPSRRPVSIRGFSHHGQLTSPSTTSLPPNPTPAPPPTRGSSRHSATGRPSSVISMDMITTPRKQASNVPPPPPPHRHGRSSFDIPSPGASQRASGEMRRSMDSIGRRGSAVSNLSQVETVDPASPVAGSNDLLADLNRLQREIDAARNAGKESVT